MTPQDRYQAAWNKWKRCKYMNCPNDNLDERGLLSCINCRLWTPNRDAGRVILKRDAAWDPDVGRPYRFTNPPSSARDPNPPGAPSRSESDSPLDRIEFTNNDIKADLEGIGLGGYI